MKREYDRFIGRPSGDEPDVSAEVYLLVTDEGRRPVSVAWRYLPFAIVFAAVAVALFVASLTSGGARSRSPLTAAPLRRQPKPASSSASMCVGAPGYGGLGARVSDFDPNNNNSTGPAGPSPGTAFYTVTATANGCVTAFAVQDGTTPPLTARGLLMLVSHPYLPGDAKPVVSTHSCVVWKSGALKRATGRVYARATAGGQAGSIPGTAEIEATSTSTC